MSTVADRIFAHLEQGHQYKQAQEHSSALKAYQQALLLDNTNPVTLNNIGVIYYLQGYLNKAENYYSQAVARKANYVDAHYNLALAQLKQNKQEARQTLLTTVKLYPQHFAAWFQLGCQAMRAQDYTQAISDFIEAQAIQKKQLELQMNLGHCYCHTNQHDLARHCYRLAAELDPADATIYYNLGVLAEKQNYIDHAINYYRDVITLNPNYFEAHNNLGVCYLAKEHYPNALKHFEMALKLQPDNESIRYKISALTQDSRQTCAPTNYIKELFNQYADGYDQHLLQALDYQVPHLFFSLYTRFCEFSRYKAETLLDLGCGTGLCGALFTDTCRHITGVDLSGEMLKQAAIKTCYQKLYEQEMLEFLEQDTKQYDLIIAGDVLVYTGTLDSIFSSVKQRLAPGGLFLFNVESSIKQPFHMDQSGRFKHHTRYIHQLALDNQLGLAQQQQAMTRTQNNDAVEGTLYLLQNKTNS